MKLLLNLYDEIRPRHVRYNLTQLAMLVAALLLGLAAWGIYASWTVARLAAERVALESEQQALVPQIETLQAELASDDRVAIARTRVSRLTLELQGRERMQALIADLSAQNVAGFSPLLKGLGSASRDDAWLTHIRVLGPRVNATPERVQLRGSLLNSSAFASYLDALAHTEAFRGVQFATVIVGNPADAAPAAQAADPAADPATPTQALTFELDTQVAEKAP